MIRHRLAIRSKQRRRAREAALLRELVDAHAIFESYRRQLVQAIAAIFGVPEAMIVPLSWHQLTPPDPTLGPDYEDHAGGGVSTRDLDELLAEIDDTLADHKTSR